VSRNLSCNKFGQPNVFWRDTLIQGSKAVPRELVHSSNSTKLSDEVCHWLRCAGATTFPIDRIKESHNVDDGSTNTLSRSYKEGLPSMKIINIHLVSRILSGSHRHPNVRASKALRHYVLPKDLYRCACLTQKIGFLFFARYDPSTQAGKPIQNQENEIAM